MRVVHFSLTSLSCHHILYHLAWMQLPVHLGKMYSVSDEECDDFLLRSQFKRYVMHTVCGIVFNHSLNKSALNDKISNPST